MLKARHVLITGASSGMGQMLALLLAPHCQTLWLNGRNKKRLEQTAQKARQAGAKVHIFICDVTDKQRMKNWIDDIDTLDLVIASAGITGGTHQADQEHHFPYEPSKQIYDMFSTDLFGVLNTVIPAIDKIRRQPRQEDGFRGRICALSSVAALVSFPGTPSYSAAKAAVDRFMTATGGSAKQDGILLSSVICGFVDTPMVAKNNFAMPGLHKTYQACRKILKGLERNQRKIIFPLWLALGSRFMDLLPISISEAYYNHQPIGAAGTLPNNDENT